MPVFEAGRYLVAFDGEHIAEIMGGEGRLDAREIEEMNRHLRLKKKDANAVRDFVQKVRAALGGKLVALRLFGSKATGRDVPDSDIDVLVVVKEASVKIEDQVLDIAFEVNLAHEVYISPRVIARATLDDPVWRITPFLQALEKESIPL
jgi:predicted nucleotidyltransferase